MADTHVPHHVVCRLVHHSDPKQLLKVTKDAKTYCMLKKKRDGEANIPGPISHAFSRRMRYSTDPPAEKFAGKKKRTAGIL